MNNALGMRIPRASIPQQSPEKNRLNSASAIGRFAIVAFDRLLTRAACDPLQAHTSNLASPQARQPRRRRHQGGWRESGQSRSRHGRPIQGGYRGERRDFFCTARQQSRSAQRGYRGGWRGFFYTSSKSGSLRGFRLLLRHVAHLLPQHRRDQRRGRSRGHHLVCPGCPGLLPTFRRADLRTRRAVTHRTAWQPPFLCLLLHGNGRLHRPRRIGRRRLLACGQRTRSYVLALRGPAPRCPLRKLGRSLFWREPHAPHAHLRLGDRSSGRAQPWRVRAARASFLPVPWRDVGRGNLRTACPEEG